MERSQYPTDLTDEQWQIIQPLLPGPSDRGSPRRIERREVVNAILYLNRAGCAWRLLPHDFPKWRTVYGIFWEWRNLGVWQEIHDALRRQVREAEGREAKPSAAIIDSQSVRTTDVGGKTAVMTPGRRSRDASGTWRSIRWDFSWGSSSTVRTGKIMTVPASC